MTTALINYLRFTENLAKEVATRLVASTIPNSVQEKAPGDWFSALDLELEKFIRERIASTFPEHGFLGEEGGAIGIADEQDFVWVVDPIDGSMNFLRGFPHFSVSIALVHAGEPIVGCVIDPITMELFSAAKGLGAHLNGQPIAVKNHTRLDQAIAATVFPKPKAAFMDRYLLRLSKVLISVAGARRTGSMALDLAYLAAGRVDVFWSEGMGAWDAAAGVLLIREAGGEVFTLDGLPWMKSIQIAAASKSLTKPWLELLTL